MHSGDYFALAKNSLFHRKMRSWLTVLGIIIGIAAVVGLVSIGQGFEKSLTEQLDVFGGNVVFISPGNVDADAMFDSGGFGGAQTLTGKLTTTDIAMLKGINGIEYVDGIVSQRADVVFRAEISTITVEGTNADLWKIFNIVDIEKGRILSASDRRVAVVGNTIAKDTFDKEIKAGDMIEIKGVSFRVIGVLKSGSGFAAAMVDNSISIPMQDAKDLFQETGSNEVNAIIIKAYDSADLSRVVKDIELRLDASHKNPPGEHDFSITSSDTLKARVSQITSTFTFFLGGIAAISLLVGAIGIANTMFMSVMERTRTIGILKALGAKNKDIRNIFLVESSMIGFIGGLIGVAIGSLFGIGLGIVMSGAQTRMSGMSFAPAITAELIIFAIAFSVIIGVLSGYFPARRAAKLNPVEALRYE
ncbi:MAG: ABC transporter permease [Candidatus Aenigmarchaeota archaeon]|nr:ABC transporter permease [Candidatus Aenigmarchaeota archaeon]